MKIAPPEVVIDPKAPFANDVFGRETFAKTLKALVGNSEGSLVIFINAPWGEGKTTFCKMWQALLRKDDIGSIYFDAFAADYFDDPFVSFSGEIMSFVGKEFPNNDQFISPKAAFSRNAIEVGKRLFGTSANVLLRLGTLNTLNVGDVKEITEAVGDLTSAVSKAGTDYVAAKLETYEREKESFAGFKKNLTDVAKKVREIQKFPLTVIVDELDRCRPEYALKLLERIKHLFDVPDLVFVILINRKQIESFTTPIGAQLAPNSDGADFLQKFGHILTELPTSEHRVRSDQCHDFCSRLATHYGLRDRGHGTASFADSVSRFATLFNMSLRDMQRVYALLAVFYSSDPSHFRADPFLASLLAILKVKRPSIYKRLSEGTISLKEFTDETGIVAKLNSNGRHPDSEWIRRVIQVCLQEESVFANLTPDARRELRTAAQGITGDNESRLTVIPTYCRNLDQFRLVA